MSTRTENIGGNGHDTGTRAEEAVRRNAGQMQKLFDDVEELLQRIAGMNEPDISQLRNKVESSIERARASARSGTQAAIESTRRAATVTDEYVHRNPWLAIGATASVALLLGALLRGTRQ